MLNFNISIANNFCHIFKFDTFLKKAVQLKGKDIWSPVISGDRGIQNLYNRRF